MSLAETFIALQTGVIDGQENPLSQIHSQRFHEVQRYLTLTGHVYTPAYLLAGRDHWRMLPESVRDVLRQTARDVQQFVYEQAEALDSRLLEEVRNDGIAINECDRERFLQAGQPLFARFASEVPQGGELIARTLALASGEQ